MVDLSNLQRQIIHTTDRVGMLKTESAQKQINALNPAIKVIRHDVRLSSENVMEIIKAYDVVINCGDNSPDSLSDQRRLRVRQKAAGRWCDFPLRRERDGVPSGRRRSVLPMPLSGAGAARHGALVRRGGRARCIARRDWLIEALEAIKLLIGAGKPLTGKMVYFDTLSSDYVRVLKIRRNPIARFAATIRRRPR